MFRVSAMSMLTHARGPVRESESLRPKSVAISAAHCTYQTWNLLRQAIDGRLSSRRTFVLREWLARARTGLCYACGTILLEQADVDNCAAGNKLGLPDTHREQRSHFVVFG